MNHARWRHHRPPWWPANEPWPPQPGAFSANRQGRVRFFRRIAIAGLAAFLLLLAVVIAVAWLLAQRHQLVPWLPFGLPLLVAVVVFVSVGIVVTAGGRTRRFFSPLMEVMDAADRVAAGDYTVRVTPSGPPPVRALAHSFNTMSERLQSSDRLRRDLMADLAHELRTPLSVLQGRLEGLLDGVYSRDDRQLEELLEETRVLERLIGDLRTLALSDAGALPLEKERIDVVALVGDVVGTMAVEARKQSVELTPLSSAMPILADVDPVRIREVLTNLLANAIRHTPSGGAVTTTIERTRDGVVVVVRDTGEGMSADEASRVFDRFYKGPNSPGSGLGLPIARAIILAHGGHVSIESQPSKGTTVRCALPAG
jgi:two-component system, OmpR family, sensor histidine kinase BaeS